MNNKLCHYQTCLMIYVSILSNTLQFEYSILLMNKLILVLIDKHITIFKLNVAAYDITHSLTMTDFSLGVN